ncbi:MAG: hypothetical protein KDC83_03420 [Flavobacteriales bacterium]|nr:hypothetical protein [Flavobacteriales bacterium]
MFVACNKESCENPIPQISIKKIDLTSSSGLVTINVMDCDGDIGVQEQDTAGLYRYNAFVDIRPFFNGEWSQNVWNYVDTGYYEIINDSGFVIGYDTIIDTLNYYYRIPYIENNSRSEIYEAEVDLKLGTGYFGFDTFRFEIKIRDRALNESNTIISETQIGRL